MQNEEINVIKSMTGFGRASATINGRDILVEIRSVNNRYFDFSARLPRSYNFLEERLKSFLQGKISRGKVEISVSIYNIETKDEIIEVDQTVAKNYINALRTANSDLDLTDDITLSKIMKLPEIFKVRKIVEDEDSVWSNILPVVTSATERIISMRETEGFKMQEDILSRLSLLLDHIKLIEDNSSSTTKIYKDKLTQKMMDILNDTNIDEHRILLEAAIFAEKTAIDEETVRLNCHISQFAALLESPEPVGRKLDFLVQEMNREANTIGSKSQDIEATRIVVDIKSELEKIREQIQNIE